MYKGSPRTVEGTKWSRDVKGSILKFGMLRQSRKFKGAMNCCHLQFCFQVCFFVFSPSRIGPIIVMDVMA